MKPRKGHANTATRALMSLLRSIVTRKDTSLLSPADAVDLAASAKRPVQLSFFAPFSDSSAEDSPWVFALLSTHQFEILMRSKDGGFDPCAEAVDFDKFRRIDAVAYRFALYYNNVSSVARLVDANLLPANMLSRPRLFNRRDRFQRAFLHHNHTWTGLTSFKGHRLRGGIILSFLPPSHGGPDNGDLAAQTSVYPSELAALTVLLGEEMAGCPDNCIGNLLSGAILINFTPTHVRVLEGAAILNESRLSIALHLSRRHSWKQDEASEMGLGDIDVKAEYRDVLRWCFVVGRLLTGDRTGLPPAIPLHALPPAPPLQMGKHRQLDKPGGGDTSDGEDPALRIASSSTGPSGPSPSSGGETSSPASESVEDTQDRKSH